MKKLDEETKQRQLRRAHRLEEIQKLRRARHGQVGVDRRPTGIAMPSTLSLSENHDEVVDTLQQFRAAARVYGRRITLHFHMINKVGPAAALIWAAELDRWRSAYQTRLAPVEFLRWSPEVYRSLYDMGFFRLLDVPRSRLPQPEAAAGADSVIKFQSSNTARGDIAKEIRLAMERLVGAPLDTNPYRGLTEAMTNVVQHAYPPEYAPPYPWIRNRWWIGGAYSTRTSLMEFFLYDQGVGIPSTLPRSRHWDWEFIRGALASVTPLEEFLKDDAQMIRAAMVAGRSSSGHSYQGRGLPDVRRFVDEASQGILRILSGGGEYTYVKGSGETLKNHRQALGGTLVHWKVWR